jgi:hypothetical protein
VDASLCLRILGTATLTLLRLLIICRRIRDDPKLPPHVRECVDFYTMSWRGFVRRYYDCGLHRPHEFDQSLPTLSYEDSSGVSPIDEEKKLTKKNSKSGGRFDDKKDAAQMTTIRPELLESYKPKLTDTLNQKARRVGRYEIFRLYSMSEAPQPHERPEPFNYPSVRRVLIEPKELKFELGNIEPYFCTLALYDFAKKLRISENFYFHLNSLETQGLLGTQKVRTKECRKALFSISYPSPDIFIVVRVEKVLQGANYDDIVEPYIKHDTLRDKDKEKLIRDAKDACTRLGRWRQPFCVGMLPLFNVSDDKRDLTVITGANVQSKDVPPSVNIMRSLYRYKGDVGDQAFFEQLPEKGSRSSKSMKPLSGYLVLDIKEVLLPTPTGKAPSVPPGTALYPQLPVLYDSVVSPSLLPLHPDKKSPTTDFVQEIQEFPQTLTPWPHLDYVNNLYIYPEYVNLTKTNTQKSARNIAVSVQFLETDDVNSALKLIYNKNYTEDFTDKIYTCVQYHNKTPQFYDEIKIKLPARLTPRHNLLFTFYHIPCQVGKNAEEFVIGYAFYPILVKGRILEKDIQIPIASELPSKFLSPGAGEAMKNSVIDGKKIVIKFRIRLVSSIYTTDKYVNAFFQDYRKSKIDKTALSLSLQGLTKAKPRVMLQFLPVLLTQLLYCVVQGGELSKEAFSAFILVLSSVHSESLESRPLLEKYLEYVFQDPRVAEVKALGEKDKKERAALREDHHWVYYELTRQWLNILRERAAPAATQPQTALQGGQRSGGVATISSGTEIERVNKYAWVLFRLMYRSMVDRLAAYGELNSETRIGRFSTEYERLLRQLVSVLGWDVQLRWKTSLSVSKELTRSLAHFLSDLFSIMDRGFVLDMTALVLRELCPCEIEQLIEFKLDFLRIIVHYEHFVQLNLAFPIKLETTNLPKLLDQYSKKHYLSTLLLRTVNEYLNHSDKYIRMKTLSILQGLFMRHDYDKRWSKKAKKQLVELYFPFILQVIDNERTFNTEVDFDERRALFVCYVYIIRNVSSKLLQQWWKRDTLTRLASFLETLCHAVQLFEHIGKEALTEKMLQESETAKSTVVGAKALLEDFYTEQGAGVTRTRFRSLREKRAEARSRGNSYSGPPIGSQSGTIKDTRRWKHSFTGDSEKKFEYNEEKETHLSHEMALTVLDALELFIQTKESELLDPHQPNILLDKVFKVIKTLLKTKQSLSFLPHLYATLRAFVHKFPKALFGMNTPYCGKLISLVLRHCNFRSAQVRTEASALIYLLMKKNYEHTKRKHFSRMKVATTIALSKLVGEGNVTEPGYLRHALDAISEYARVDTKGADPEFTEQVTQLVTRLNTILEDSVKIFKHAQNKDTEMLADLYHHIAQSYASAPDLRVTWLESLAALHERNKAWAEAGIAVVHIAALIAEYLNILEPIQGLPAGCAAFENVCVSALEEALDASSTNFVTHGASLDPQRVTSVTDEDGGLDSNMFTEEGLVKVMERAVEYLKQAELYETCNELYKLIIPIHEKNRNYQKLSQCHQDLKGIFDKIIVANQNESRFLGSYYRVAFFGHKFEELHGKEYIYKEPKLTRLGEITDRLVKMYEKKFGESTKVTVLTTSIDPDVSKLDVDNQCYLQITSVEPYFESWELKERITQYDRAYNVSTFIFETPFTKDEKGKQQASDLSKQYKRKTILTIDTPFPYMKTRALVTRKQTIELTPIENALETVEKRIAKLQQELRNPNVKTLMGVLQGTVAPQVHSGSTEICKTFLTEPSKYDPQQIDALRHALQEFLEVCEDALTRSRQLITPEQLSFQTELEEGFRTLKQFMEPYLSSAGSVSST